MEREGKKKDTVDIWEIGGRRFSYAGGTTDDGPTDSLDREIQEFARDCPSAGGGRLRSDDDGYY